MQYCVYILTNKRKTVLYTGMTSNLVKRIDEHKSKKNEGSFSKRYNLCHLVYYEELSSQNEALERERMIKKKSRRGKEILIAHQNPNWNDLHPHGVLNSPV